MTIQVRLLGKTPLTPEALERIPPQSALVMVYVGKDTDEHVGLLVETTEHGEEVPIKVIP